MRLTILSAVAGIALAGCNQAGDAPAATNDATAAAPAAAPEAAATALASINETSWEYTDAKTGKAIQQSVDAAGKYIANAGAEHFDHGTAMMKDGKACFTSAMNQDGEVCWSDPMLAEGQAGETTSDNGETLTVKRVAYTPLTM